MPRFRVRWLLGNLSPSRKRKIASNKVHGSFFGIYTICFLFTAIKYKPIPSYGLSLAWGPWVHFAVLLFVFVIFTRSSHFSLDSYKASSLRPRPRPPICTIKILILCHQKIPPSSTAPRPAILAPPSTDPQQF